MEERLPGHVDGQPTAKGSKDTDGEDANDLYGLQVAQTTYTDAERGELRLKHGSNGQLRGVFISEEDLKVFHAAKSVCSVFNAPGVHKGYALADRKTGVAFLFRADECPESVTQLWVGNQRLSVPGRRREDLPKTPEALVAVHVYPASRPDGAKSTGWVAGNLASLSYEKPRLVARVVKEAPLRDYFLRFLEDYLASMHKKAAWFDAREKNQHGEVLNEICAHTGLESLHEWAAALRDRLGNGGAQSTGGVRAPVRPTSGLLQTKGPGQDGQKKEERKNGLGRDLGGVPIMSLDLDEEGTHDG